MDGDTAGRPERTPPTAREARLAAVMASAAERDPAAVFALRESFADDLERTVRTIASSRGARLSADEVDQLAVDVAMELYALAPGWNPDFGVPPWVWARHRVAAVLTDRPLLERASRAAERRAADFSEAVFAARWSALFNELAPGD